MYSEQSETGIWDARMKLPILVLPLVFGAAGPVSAIQVRRILWVFTLSILVGTLASTAVLFGVIDRPVDDIRDIFIFHISHIRFALFTCLSFYFLGWQIATGAPSRLEKLLSALLMVWFIIFLVLAEIDDRPRYPGGLVCAGIAGIGLAPEKPCRKNCYIDRGHSAACYSRYPGLPVSPRD
jgi:hypothetical protein